MFRMLLAHLLQHKKGDCLRLTELKQSPFKQARGELCVFQRVAQILNDIFHIFNSDGKPDHSR